MENPNVLQIQNPRMKTPDGKHIHCDGKDCREIAYLPVGLRAALATERLGQSAGVAGWLFVDRDSGSLHFCPACGKLYLRDLNAKTDA